MYMYGMKTYDESNEMVLASDSGSLMMKAGAKSIGREAAGRVKATVGAASGGGRGGAKPTSGIPRRPRS